MLQVGRFEEEIASPYPSSLCDVVGRSMEAQETAVLVGF
jgi:hypothetical protein